MIGAQLVPPRLEKLTHTVTRLADRAVVFVERFAVVENLSYVRAEVFSGFVSVIYINS